jgi:hypothetical protein
VEEAHGIGERISMSMHAAAQEEPGMFDLYRHFPWFLKVHYDNQKQLIAELGSA